MSRSKARNGRGHDQRQRETGRDLTRRTFLKLGSAASGALALGVYLPGCASWSQRHQRREMAEIAEKTGDFVPNAWLKITPASEVVLYLDRVEMGQGTMTSHAMLVAEELEVAPAEIRVVPAGADRSYDNPLLGFQITGGSTSVKASWRPLRQAAAAAREMLRQAAAAQWEVKVSECEAVQGEIVHGKSGRRARYGELTQIAALLPIPEPRLKKPAQFRVIGKPIDRVDARMKVDGSGVFGMDVKVPDMLNAVIVRSPVRGGTVRRFRPDAALRHDGVRDVFEVPAGIAVVADTYWQARTAAALVDVEWNEGELAGLDEATLRQGFVARASEGGKAVRDDGDVGRAFAGAARTIEAVYEVPYLAHATMEPMNCTAHVTGDRCDIWAPTQSPGLALELAARITGLDRRDIAVHNTLLGGGFGRRLAQDYVAEAVHVSRHIGRPVKITWSREDDMANDFYRPRTYNLLRGAVSAEGRPVAWLHRIVGQTIVGQVGKDWLDGMAPSWMPLVIKGFMGHSASGMYQNNVITDQTSVEGAVSVPYRIDSLRVEYAEHETQVPVGFWRSVGHSENAFVVESFIDELAHAAGKDPYRFRRELLARAPRERRVLDVVAQKIGWGTPPPAGQARGIAQHASFGSACAHAVEVSVSGGKLRVHRVVSAIDCGMVVNPDIVTAQVESAVVFGLSAALRQQITFQNGRVQQTNFHQYSMLRMHEMPRVEVYIVPSNEAPEGAGEPGLPPIAPAVTNAIFAATGKRIRTLPIEPALRERGGHGA